MPAWWLLITYSGNNGTGHFSHQLHAAKLPFRISYNLLRTSPLGTQRTSEWKRRFWWSEPISSYDAFNNLVFKVPLFM